MISPRTTPRMLFVTGTGTGVGKTVLAGLLGAQLHAMGVEYALLKPVCTGGRGEARKLCKQQRGRISLDDINPFHFEPAVSPWVAAREAGRRITVEGIGREIRRVGEGKEWVIVEGAGGILVPLNKRESFADLAQHLGCPCVIVAQNRLGVLNHSRLTLNCLRGRGIDRVMVLLVDSRANDDSVDTNAGVLKQCEPWVTVKRLKRVDVNSLWKTGCVESDKSVKKTLAQLIDFARFSPLFNRTV